MEYSTQYASLLKSLLPNFQEADDPEDLEELERQREEPYKEFRASQMSVRIALVRSQTILRWMGRTKYILLL